MDEKKTKEVEVLLDEVLKELEAGNVEAAKAKIKDAKEHITRPLPGTGSNGLEK